VRPRCPDHKQRSLSFHCTFPCKPFWGRSGRIFLFLTNFLNFQTLKNFGNHLFFVWNNYVKKHLYSTMLQWYHCRICNLLSIPVSFQHSCTLLYFTTTINVSGAILSARKTLRRCRKSPPPQQQQINEMLTCVNTIMNIIVISKNVFFSTCGRAWSDGRKIHISH